MVVQTAQNGGLDVLVLINAASAQRPGHLSAKPRGNFEALEEWSALVTAMLPLLNVSAGRIAMLSQKYEVIFRNPTRDARRALIESILFLPSKLGCRLQFTQRSMLLAMQRLKLLLQC